MRRPDWARLASLGLPRLAALCIAIPCLDTPRNAC